MLRVIVVAYKNGDWLETQIESLRKHVQVPFEVIFWNNGGLEEKFAELKKKFHGMLSMHVAGHGENIGFSKAVNEAAKIKTQNEWTDLLLLNPDAFLLSDFGPNEFQQYKSTGGICGLAVFDDVEKKHRQSNARSFPNIFTAVTGREGVLTKLWPTNPFSQKYLGTHLDEQVGVHKVDWVSGSALLCARENWQHLGGFEEDYFLYVEDVDLGRKAKVENIPVYFFPLVSVCHQIRGSSQGQVHWRSDAYHHWGMWVYHTRWSGFFGFMFGPFIFAGILLRFLVRRVRGVRI